MLKRIIAIVEHNLRVMFDVQYCTSSYRPVMVWNTAGLETENEECQLSIYDYEPQQ